MTSEKFFKLVKKVVVDYINSHIIPPDNLEADMSDVFLVWYCKTLQNWKALVSTTLEYGLYFELTLNGNRNELYLDVYKKVKNKCIDLSTLMAELEEGEK